MRLVCPGLLDLFRRRPRDRRDAACRRRRQRRPTQLRGRLRQSLRGRAPWCVLGSPAAPPSQPRWQPPGQSATAHAGRCALALAGAKPPVHGPATRQTIPPTRSSAR